MIIEKPELTEKQAREKWAAYEAERAHQKPKPDITKQRCKHGGYRSLCPECSDLR